MRVWKVLYYPFGKIRRALDRRVRRYFVRLIGEKHDPQSYKYARRLLYHRVHHLGRCGPSNLTPIKPFMFSVLYFRIGCCVRGRWAVPLCARRGGGSLKGDHEQSRENVGSDRPIIIPPTDHVRSDRLPLF